MSPDAPATTDRAPGGAPALTAALLAWYDRHRRDLPWRAKAGDAADPYRVWLSEIMLQQTTVQAVKPYFAAFLARFPTVEALAAAPPEAVMQAWAGLGYYSRARNLHACAKRVVDAHGGRFPGTETALRELPGIGAYTAGAVAAIAFQQPAVAVDGNVERVMGRMLAIDTPLPSSRGQIAEATRRLLPIDRPGDFAQALMDLGAMICTPRGPACGLCPWRPSCAAHREGQPERYPVKLKKAAGALRRGAAFIAYAPGRGVLLRTRPAKGLLGGMAEPPTTDWSPAFDVTTAPRHAPLAGDWLTANAPVRHVFTHFPLELTVLAARLGDAYDLPPAGTRLTPLDRLSDEPLPTVMRRALEVGLNLLGERFG